jgi:hypothetical protein
MLEMMRMRNISFIYTVKNSSHQLQDIQNFVQALIHPSHIISQKLSLMTSSEISNCSTVRLSFWHQGYSSEWESDATDTRREVSLNKNH